MSLIKTGLFAHFDCGSDCDQPKQLQNVKNTAQIFSHSCPPHCDCETASCCLCKGAK